MIKLLVAEDDKFLMKVYQSKLEKEGFEFIGVGDGESALKQMREDKPMVVLLDLIMPIKNGFEVLEEMKADEALKDIPVLILSNLGQEADMKKGKELGATDFIVKSNMSINEVVEKIKSVVG